MSGNKENIPRIEVGAVPGANGEPREAAGREHWDGQRQSALASEGRSNHEMGGRR